MTTPPLPEQIKLHRDRMWRRDEDLCVEGAADAERFIEDVGLSSFASKVRNPTNGSWWMVHVPVPVLCSLYFDFFIKEPLEL
jgi:hypothetical protein